MSYQVSFASARAKFERAEMHRNALDHNIRQVFAEKANRISVSAEIDPESGYHVFRIESVPELDPIIMQLGLGVGDVIHNLRGALDHLFWQLACFHTNGSPPDPRLVQFPMDDDPGWFPKRPVRADLDPAHWDIIETHQPYHGQDGRPDSWVGPHIHPLALLRNLSNDDKHKVTPPVLAIPSGLDFFGTRGIEFRPFIDIDSFEGFEVETVFSHLNVGEVVALGLPVGRALLTGPGAKPKIDDAGQVIPSVALAEGRSVVPTIDRLARRVDLILGEFEPLFPA